MDFSRLLSDFFTEQTWIAILLVGVLLVVIGYYWLAARAVQASKWWRIGYIPPFANLYIFSGSSRVVAPVLLMFVGAGVAAAPFVITRYVQPLLPRHPWEKNVDGELHVTLTDLKNFNYDSLKARPEIVVLQMGNPDVTDQTLESIRTLPNLRELDIKDSAITDAGLATLKDFPSLTTLSIARTKITDDGFNQNLAPIDRIVQLDLTGTDVKSSSKRKWKNAIPGRKYID